MVKTKTKPTKKHTTIPLSISPVSAGFPSPAEDYIDQDLDLHTHLIKHPAATFFVRVSGNSMHSAGIYDNDILIVDRSLIANHNTIVVAVYNGEFTVKRFYKQNNIIQLHPENNAFPIITIKQDDDFSIWGVVVSVVRKY